MDKEGAPGRRMPERRERDPRSAAKFASHRVMRLCRRPFFVLPNIDLRFIGPLQNAGYDNELHGKGRGRAVCGPGHVLQFLKRGFSGFFGTAEDGS